MLRPRIVPCLLLRNGGLVKTICFDKPKYIGDPLNAVRIFNEKQVDEIIVLDIDAAIQERELNVELIRRLASECRMPLCIGGGIRTVEQIENIISLGVEKVAISSAAVSNPQLIREASARVGSQSVVVVMDVKKVGFLNRYELFVHNGRKPTGLNPVEFAKEVETLGAGEIVINSIDCDGVMKGYDLELVKRLRECISLPVTVLGGAGSLDHISDLVRDQGIIGAAAGSLFVFKGVHKAVLINYPNPEEKDTLLNEAMVHGQGIS
jgi:cyclase